MSTPAKRRLLKDLQLLNTTEEKVYAQPLEDDLMTWVGIILGPDNTIYENGIFTLLLVFDESYPNIPPTIRFISKMFHPNIYENGDLCLDILKSKWSPTFDVLSILLSVQSLLNDPNCDSPANLEAAEVYQNGGYNEIISTIVELSWDDIENLKMQKEESQN